MSENSNPVGALSFSFFFRECRTEEEERERKSENKEGEEKIEIFGQGEERGRNSEMAEGRVGVAWAQAPPPRLPGPANGHRGKERIRPLR